MGNKTVKLKEPNQNVDTDRKSVNTRRQPNEDKRKTNVQNVHNAKSTLQSSSKLEKDTETTETGKAELPLEYWTKPNFDFLMDKTDVETDPLQNVFKQIKREKNMDVNRTSLLYTTSKEKYLIKLISEGHNITTKIVSHVLDKWCGTEAHMLNDHYGCCCGYVLKKEDFMSHDFKDCNSFHRLNSDIICYQGKVFYPVDLFFNPFAEWNPKDMVEDGEQVQYLYDMILQTWPNYQLFGTDISKYLSISERYLIKLINSGHSLPRDVIAHVVNGCDIKSHLVNENYGCCYGFILTRDDFLSHDNAMKNMKRGKRNYGIVYAKDGKPDRNKVIKDFEQCDAEHDINEKLKCSSGILFYELVTFQRPCKFLRSRFNLEANIPVPKKHAVKEVYKRIKFKALNEPDRDIQFTWHDKMHAWEKYLIKLINEGYQISIELMSHVIDGCHIAAHLVDDNFGCCYGFILTKEEFMMHSFRQCRLEHEINDELMCDRGWVYHRRSPMDCPFHDLRHLGGTPFRMLKLKDVPRGDAPNPRPPPQPAPPPPDHLDQ